MNKRKQRKRQSQRLDRRRFIEAAGTAAVATLLAAAGTSCASAAPQQGAAGAPTEPFRLVAAPVLQNVSREGVTVLWSVNGRSNGWVEYGTAPDALTQKSGGGEGGLFPLEEIVHKIRLRGLEAGKTYYYRVACRPIDFQDAYHIVPGATVYSPVYAFTTLSGASASTVSFSVINDTHEHANTLERLMPQLIGGKTDLTFWNGDVFNDIRSEAHLAERLLSPAGGEGYASQSPLFVVRGNHDVRGVEARLLDRFTDTPDGRYYYTFRQGPIAFLILDSGEDKEDATPVYAGLNDFAAYRAEQREWLKAAIRQKEFRDAPFRVALIHIPLCIDCEGSRDSKANWHDLLVAGKIDLVISGHTHRHAYHPPTAAFPYPMLVGGGPNPPEATLIRAHADSHTLTVAMQDLDGKELGRYVYARRA